MLKLETYAHHLLTEIAVKYDLPDVYYLDLWPFSYSMVILRDPDLVDHALTTQGLQQHPCSAEFVEPYFGANVIAATNGPAWKQLHHSLSPAFSWSSIRNLTGVIFAECDHFRARLKELADSDTAFSLERLVERLVFDINGQVVFNEHLKSQQDGTPLLNDVTEVMDLLECHMDFANRMNPVKQAKLRWNLPRLKAKIDKAVQVKVQSRLEKLLDRDQVPSRSSPDSVLDSMLRVHIQNDEDAGGALKRARKLPTAQMQTLVAKSVTRRP